MSKRSSQPSLKSKAQKAKQKQPMQVELRQQQQRVELFSEVMQVMTQQHGVTLVTQAEDISI